MALLSDCTYIFFAIVYLRWKIKRNDDYDDNHDFFLFTEKSLVNRVGFIKGRSIKPVNSVILYSPNPQLPILLRTLLSHYGNASTHQIHPIMHQS